MVDRRWFADPDGTPLSTIEGGPVSVSHRCCGDGQWFGGWHAVSPCPAPNRSRSTWRTSMPSACSTDAVVNLRAHTMTAMSGTRRPPSLPSSGWHQMVLNNKIGGSTRAGRALQRPQRLPSPQRGRCPRPAGLAARRGSGGRHPAPAPGHAGRRRGLRGPGRPRRGRRPERRAPGHCRPTPTARRSTCIRHSDPPASARRRQQQRPVDGRSPEATFPPSDPQTVR